MPETKEEQIERVKAYLTEQGIGYGKFIHEDGTEVPLMDLSALNEEQLKYIEDILGNV